MPSDHMELIVHPGIGDLSWVFSKLSTTGKKFDLVIAQDSKTQRALPLANMIPCINKASYGGGELYHLLYKCKNAKFSEYEKAAKEGKQLVMTANPWVDAGNRLEGYLPDLDTDFHYDIHGSKDECDWADRQLQGIDRAVGIYTSCRAGIDNWRGWAEYEWADFIRLFQWQYPQVTFFLFGASWDQDMRLPMRRLLNGLDVDYKDMIGRTTLGRALELIRRMDYFAGFASGLTILSNVVGTPVLMLYPDMLSKLMHSWPCPISMADGTYQGQVWRRPVEIMHTLKLQLSKHLE